jgi:hypothetical protein
LKKRSQLYTGGQKLLRRIRSRPDISAFSFQPTLCVFRAFSFLVAQSHQIVGEAKTFGKQKQTEKRLLGGKIRSKTVHNHRK